MKLVKEMTAGIYLFLFVLLCYVWLCVKVLCVLCVLLHVVGKVKGYYYWHYTAKRRDIKCLCGLSMLLQVVSSLDRIEIQKSEVQHYRPHFHL